MRDRFRARRTRTEETKHIGQPRELELAPDAGQSCDQSSGHDFGLLGVTALTRGAGEVGSRAVPVVQRRRTAVPVQRDGPLTLQPPSLLQQPDPSSRYHIGGDQQLHLDPAIQAMAGQYIEQQLDPAALRPALSRISLTSGALALPGAPGAGAAGPASPPAANPLAGPAVPQSAPVVPAGEGPETPREASLGDLVDAIIAVPAIDQALTNLQTQVTDRVTRDWSQLQTGGKIGVVSTVAVIGGGALAGVASDPAARQTALGLLNGRTIPVPGVSWLHLELNTGDDNVMVGMHVDVGALLPPSLGFGPGSPTAIGGPPQPEPFVPGQRRVDRAARCPAVDEDEHDGGLLARRIVAASNEGARLEPDVQDRLETALQFDLRSARVHTGGEADRLARSVDAVAFTSGRDIFFRAGAYSPSSAEGFQLLAHEATHTVQQAQGPVAGSPTVGGVSLSDPSDLYERSADRAAAAAAERDRSRKTAETAAQLPGVARGPAVADASPGHDFARLSMHSPAVMADAPPVPVARTQARIDATVAAVPAVQRKAPTTNRSGAAHVGGEEGSITFLPGPGGTTLAPGEAGFSRRMLADTGAAAEHFEGYQDARLTNVAPSLGVLDKQIKKRGDEVAYFQDKIDEFLMSNFGKKMYTEGKVWCQQHAQELESNRASEEEKIASYNAWVPRANGFFTSLTRLDAMQEMLGVKDPSAMATALAKGLSDAQAVGERAQLAQDAGSDNSLHVPAVTESVAGLSAAATQAAHEMNTAYLGFQRNALADRAAATNAEGQPDRDRLQQINEVKTFVRNVGKTVDVTMSVVSGAPAAISNATTAVERAGATVNAARNRRLINQGKAPRHNPTYVTVNEKGEMIVRNVQTGMDRPIEGGDQSASPESGGISLPTSVSDLLGTIADFAYAGEIREINMKLESVKARCDAINGAAELVAIRERAQNFQDKLNAFALKCNEMQKGIQQRRQDYLEFGVQLDSFARKDAASRGAGQAPGQGQERFATIMTVVSQVREVLAIGEGAAGGFDAPRAIEAWAQDLYAVRRKSPPRTDIEYISFPDSEWAPLEAMYGNVKTFHSNVGQLTKIFASVETQARQLIGALHQGSGGTGGAY